MRGHFMRGYYFCSVAAGLSCSAPTCLTCWIVWRDAPLRGLRGWDKGYCFSARLTPLYGPQEGRRSRDLSQRRAPLTRRAPRKELGEGVSMNGAKHADFVEILIVWIIFWTGRDSACCHPCGNCSFILHAVFVAG